MDASTNALEPESRPRPRRRGKRWLRILLVAGVTALLFPAVRGLIARRHLHEAIERRRAAGEPVRIEDFAQTATVDDSENAVIAYRNAAQLLHNTVANDTVSAEVIESRTSLQESNDRLIWTARQNLPALKQFLEATHRTKVDWHTTLQSPLCLSILGSWSGERKLAKLVQVGAVASATEGEFENAVELTTGLLIYADAFDTGPDTTLVRHLCACSFRDMAAMAVERMLPMFANAVELEQASRAGLERELRKLQATLITAKQATLGWETAMFLDRAAAIEAVELIADGNSQVLARKNVHGSDDPWVVRVFSFQKLYEQLDELIVVYDNWRFSGLEGIGSQSEERECPLLARGENQMSFLLPNGGAAVRVHFLAQANCRMAAIAIAIKLFELKNGKRPDRLEELVPEFIAAIPLDSMAPHETPVGYDPEGSPPVLKLTDDYTIPANKRGTIKTWMGTTPDRQFFFLNGDRPAKKEATPARGQLDLLMQSKSRGR